MATSAPTALAPSAHPFPARTGPPRLPRGPILFTADPAHSKRADPARLTPFHLGRFAEAEIEALRLDLDRAGHPLTPISRTVRETLDDAVSTLLNLLSSPSAGDFALGDGAWCAIDAVRKELDDTAAVTTMLTESEVRTVCTRQAITLAAILHATYGEDGR